MHLFAPEVGMMGTSGIVGPCILQAAGAGYSFKLLKTDRVAVAFFGDGAVNNGAFHEGLNMAGIWKLPVLFVCENNQFATEVPFAYAGGNPSVAGRGGGLRHARASRSTATTSLAVYEAAARGGRPGPRAARAPTLIECKTYRTRPTPRGWATSPTGRARRSRSGRRAARSSGSGSRSLEAALAERGRARGDRRRGRGAGRRRASQFAEASPWPDPATATEHVYAEPGTPTGEPVRNDAADAGGREITFMQATLEALAEEMAREPDDLRDGRRDRQARRQLRARRPASTTGTAPMRLCDTPICERGFVGLAGGAAMTGTRPVIDFMFADFVLDAVGEIVNQIAKMQYMSSGRLEDADPAARLHRHRPLGGDAPLGQLLPDVRPLPRPARRRPVDALRRQGPAARGPCAATTRCCSSSTARSSRIKGPVPEEDYEIEFGRAAVVREGTDVTVVALALMVHQAPEGLRDRWSARGSRSS